jgi:NAD(P)-dependent dehydrogenase (short-subunit alcohol dehydrogenase family)
VPSANRAHFLDSLFGLENRVAVVTGGSGAIGSAVATALALAGARVVVLSRGRERAEEVAAGIQARGGEAVAVPADVLDRSSLIAAREAVIARWGSVTTLVNAAGGNVPAATVPEAGDVFAMSPEGFREVVDLNLFGTLLPSLVFGQAMVRAEDAAIVNVSSMAAARALTRVGGYGAAKAAVENLTRWLAVELGRRYKGSIRVNAIAPGFFIGAQNRSLLLEPDGGPTARGQTVLAHTPIGRFGETGDLLGALVWLCSPAARFVNGIVLPVDGGFNAFSGV